MTRIQVVMSCAVLSVGVCLGVRPAAAQSSRLEGGVSHQSGFDFFWETRLSPPVPALKDFGTAILSTPPDVVHRVMLDRAKKIYFGYSVRVDVQPEPNTYRVTFEALTMTPELRRMLGENESQWRQLATPVLPTPRTIRAGDVLELPLLVSDAWGQRLTDYVTVREPRPPGFEEIGPREFSFAIGTPRDFKVDDAELRIENPFVSIYQTNADGARITSISGRTVRTPGEVAGQVLWVYVPHKGRYSLSLLPRPGLGFRRAGEVRGTSLRFATDAGTVAMTSASRIAPGDAPFNLYVKQDSGWKPTYPNANLDAIVVGAADRAEYLINK